MEYSGGIVVTPYLLAQIEVDGFPRGTDTIIINAPICEDEKYAELLAKGVQSTGSIKVIKFQAGATSDTLRALSAYLKSSKCSINTLIITGFTLDEEWNEVVSDVLASSKSITALKLERNNLSSSTLDMISPHLSTGTTILELSLQGNGFDETRLAAMLQKNTSVQKLDLSLCEIDDADCLIIVEALKANKSLRVLDLSQNQFSVKGLAHSYMTQYEGLRCSGHEALRDLLLENEVLEELYIDCCDTDFEDVRHICQALEQNRTLTNLRIDQPKYCKEERRLIEKYVRRNAMSKGQYNAAMLLHNIMQSSSALLPVEIWIEILSYAFPDLDDFNEFALNICRNHNK